MRGQELRSLANDGSFSSFIRVVSPFGLVSCLVSVKRKGFVNSKGWQRALPSKRHSATALSDGARDAIGEGADGDRSFVSFVSLV